MTKQKAENTNDEEKPYLFSVHVQKQRSPSHVCFQDNSFLFIYIKWMLHKAINSHNIHVWEDLLLS